MVPVLIAIVVVGFVAYLVRSVGSAERSSLRCSSCRHFRGSEEDGAFCGYGDIEQFKTLEDIAKCVNHEAPG